MKNLKWYFAYSIVACLGLALPFSISVQMMTPSNAQTPDAQTFEQKLQTAPSHQILEQVNAEDQEVESMPNPPVKASIDPNLLGVDSDETYIYDPTGKRDPFLAFKPVVMEFIPEVIQRQTQDLEALQLYEIDELKVVGILWGTSNPKALIKDPLGNVHTLVRLQKLGKNNGYVEAIREGAVLAVEDALENGKLVKVVKTLSIRK